MKNNEDGVRLRVRRLAWLVALAWATPGTWAQVAAPSGGTLKEVVVSGSRVEQGVEEVPATITTIGSGTT